MIVERACIPAERVVQATASLLDAGLSFTLHKVDQRLLAALADADIVNVPRFIEHVGKLLWLRLDHRDAPALSHRQPALAEWRLLKTTRTGAFALMCSGNGYRRQRALEAVKEVPNAFCLGPLMARLNDWVAEVRAAANATIARLAPDLGSGILLDSLELYLSSLAWSRLGTDDRALLDRLFAERLPSEVVTDWIVARTDDRASALMKSMLRHGAWDSGLPRIAISARHWRVRLRALEALLAGEHRWQQGWAQRRRPLTIEIDREALIAQSLGHTSPSIRRAALRAYAETLETRPDARERLSALVLDRSVKVAAVAAFWLRHSGGDPAALIRSHVKSGAPVATATLQLLGDIGAPADGQLLLGTANAAAGRRRWAALAAAAQLAPDLAFPVIEAIARGDDANEAGRALRTLATFDRPIATDLLTHWAQKPNGLVAHNLLRVVHRVPPWRTLALLLTMSCHGVPMDILEKHFQLTVTRSAQRWRPSGDERKQLQALIDAVPAPRQGALAILEWTLHHAS